MSQEPKSARPQIKNRITSSHRELTETLKWENNHRKVQDLTIDSFWLRTPMSRELSFEIIDCYRQLIEPTLEKLITERFPVVHVGAFPHHKTLYYATSTIEELIQDHYLEIDFPMLGGYVGYKRGLSSTVIEEQQSKVRDSIETVFDHFSRNAKTLMGEFNNSWDIYWGSIEDAVQHPNMIYFCKSDGFLYGSDEFENQIAPHSILFDYQDLLLGNRDYEDMNDRQLEFRRPSDHSQSRKVSPENVSFLFEKEDEGPQEDSSANMTEVAEIPLTDIEVNLRSHMVFKFCNRVSR